MRSVRLSAGSERVEVILEAREDVVVSGDARVQVEHDRTTIDHPRGRLQVRAPIGTDLVVGTTSGRVKVTGRAGATNVVTESGRVEIDDAASVDVRTRSGRVTVIRATGECRVRSESGRVDVGACGGADAATESGRIVLANVSGPARAHCVSGRIDVAMVEAHDVDAETVSGRVNVSLPSGCVVHRVTDGREMEARPADCDCTVRAMSTSGRVEVSSR